MIIVGLGNPGKEYENTRHNIGFMFVDQIAKAYQVEFRLEKKFQALVANIVINCQTHYLVKPMTYMNLSGTAVKAIVDYYKVSIADVFIVHDDMDLPLAQVRIRKNGSSGGHNGMKSIFACLGTQDVCRMRIGIDKKKANPVVDYVLSRFSKSEMEPLNLVFEKAPQIFSDYIAYGNDYLMNHYNGGTK